MKSLCSLLLVLLTAGLALLLSGCGGGGGGTTDGPSLITTPYSRGTGPISQSLDLAGALNNVDAPAGKELLILTDSVNGPLYYLGTLEVPSETSDFYALGESSTFTRGQSAVKSRLLAKNEIAISGLARALARSAGGFRSGTRDTISIDSTGENGIHWVGSYTYSVVGSAANSTLNVTGTRNNLTVIISVESNSDSTQTTTNTATTNDFTYRYTITGTVPGAVTTDTIHLTATGDGSSDESLNLNTFAGSVHQDEQTEYQIAVNNRVTYQANTELNYSHLTTNGSDFQITTSYTADAWLFAADGYWVHAITTLDVDGGNEDFTFTVVGSDGYTLNSNGTTGTLTDANQNVLANLSYDDETGIVKVDYTFTMEVQGAPDYVEIDLYML